MLPYEYTPSKPVQPVTTTKPKTVAAKTRPLSCYPDKTTRPSHQTITARDPTNKNYANQSNSIQNHALSSSQETKTKANQSSPRPQQNTSGPLLRPSPSTRNNEQSHTKEGTHSQQSVNSSKSEYNFQNPRHDHLQDHPFGLTPTQTSSLRPRSLTSRARKPPTSPRSLLQRNNSPQSYNKSPTNQHRTKAPKNH